MAYLGWLFVGLIIGSVGEALFKKLCMKSRSPTEPATPTLSERLAAHFSPLPVDQIVIAERQFPFRVRADLQRSFDSLFGEDTRILHFCGIRREYLHEPVKLTDCLIPGAHSPAVATPPEYEQLDVGEGQPVQVLKNGLWLLERKGIRFAVLLAPATGPYGMINALQIQIGVPNSPDSVAIRQEFFLSLEQSVQQAGSYRGKILSLEDTNYSYSGASAGITVHKLRLVERDQVVLPEKTLALLERNVIQFVRQRQQLAEFRQSTKKGILFYGPPGTGKTHTIHYLAQALPGHTTLLVSAEQVGLLSDYMTLARLLQPSIVVLEDVDLIARDRLSMNSVCEEVLLNKLLNEMDGLKEDADILFILTTNRPEALEAALASRPGRVDQAIEFPAPDEEGRRKLIALYSKGANMNEQLVAHVIDRTAGVSAAFIKELMRRTVQYHIERDGSYDLSQADIDDALDEMLFSGGSLNLKLLGASQHAAVGFGVAK